MAENKSNFGFYTLMLGIITLGGYFVLKAQGKTISQVIKPIKNIIPIKPPINTSTSSGSGNIGTSQYANDNWKNLDINRPSKCNKSPSCKSFLESLNAELKYRKENNGIVGYVDFFQYSHGEGIFIYDKNKKLYFLYIQNGVWVYHKVPPKMFIDKDGIDRTYFALNSGIIVNPNVLIINDELKYLKKGCDGIIYSDGVLDVSCKKEKIKTGVGGGAYNPTKSSSSKHATGQYENPKDFWSK